MREAHRCPSWICGTLTRRIAALCRRSDNPALAGQSMTGIGGGFLFAFTRFFVVLVNEIEKKKLLSESGFWLEGERNMYFVTNRHNLDPTLKLGPEVKYK